MNDPLKPFLDAAVEFINAPDWTAGQQIVEAKQNLLLAPTMEKAFDLLQRQYADQPTELEMIQQHRAILLRCKELGIDAAFTELKAATAIPQPIIEAVMQFLNAPEWSDSQQVVKTHQRRLLTDEADQVFAGLIAKYTGHAEELDDLQRHRALLAECRAIGIEAAFVPLLTPTDAPPQSMIDAVLAFINAATVEEKQQVITQKETLLLDPRTDGVFATLLAQYQNDQHHRDIITNNQLLIQKSREHGIQPVFAELRAEGTTRVTHEVMDAVRAYIGADGWADAQQIVEANAQDLLAPAADAALHMIVTQMANRDDLIATVRQRQRVLQRCREIGIVGAFSEVSP